MIASNIALIVAGPTCSGKSALALRLAQRFAGSIINADSMQVYRDLRIITARPSDEDLGLVPHKLYGVLDGHQTGSVAWWQKEALAALKACQSENRLPIFCGGTGMYLRSIIEGLVEIPPPGPQAREEARSLLESLGPEGLHARLLEQDPETASRLHITDSQRLARAWEVLRGTGKGLSAWQKEPQLPPTNYRFISVRLDPDRTQLRQAIAERFAAMLKAGALEEIKALLEKNLSSSRPIMRAHGVPELIAVAKGELSLAEAEEKAITATRQYTRRQATWFRHHALGKDEDNIISFQRFGDNEKFSESEFLKIENFITQRIDNH
ncbi:tRNA (adenosine(37)-N6)-dimethylallyltransferase MiaA [Aristophania vespae]|uniref:tRNA (adenosine(37)-N6)-dimethylallyltransferase MiaA n=1 Tax=Aristophania vespae TaxID=2697033 RepID=UPI00235137A0|nr:tRNA (adenosine(37)-N6)-dimethylallyltransferase MiaA [Aristophania vespae]UMM64075.1 tRNA dimethylallyltransferase [Aristophania vespae]